MPVVRVWNQARTKKKTLIASSLQELVQKGTAKCEIGSETSGIRVVLEECGTDIDDDEVFEAYHDKVFMLLGPDEIWSSATQVTSLSDAVDQIESRSAATENNNTAVMVEKTTEQPVEPPLPSVSPLTRPLVTTATNLPPLTEYIKEKLAENQSKEVWSKLINMSAEYYLDKFPEIGQSSEYQAIGEKMYRMFPGIKHDHGRTPWALFCKDLSQRIRWLKWFRKKKSALPTNESTLAPPRKIFRVETPNGNTAQDESSPEDYEKNVEQLKKEYEKRQSNESVIKMLIKETHNRRILWIKTLPRGTISPILKKFPVFESGRYVLYEFALLIGKKEVKEITDRILAFQDAIEDLIGEKTTGPLRFLPCIQYIEKNTQMDKGKGVKSKSILVHKKDIPDENKDKQSDTKEEEAPKLIMFTEGSENKLEEMLIAGDRSMIYTNGESLIDGVLILIAVYYIFDLNYPRQYTQLLGCIQDYVLNEPYTGPKSKKYIQLSKELNKKLRK